MAAELVSDALWSLIGPLLPASAPKPQGGRPRVSDRACLIGEIGLVANFRVARHSPTGNL